MAQKKKNRDDGFAIGLLIAFLLMAGFGAGATLSDQSSGDSDGGDMPQVTTCNDGIDNDNDGLTDSQDPECDPMSPEFDENENGNVG
ncbi:MAG: hypothetical protein CMA22_08320 [Euryarchaeota archaeon]|nr:hypothetical protein [Euryarchaeota archaeon]MAU73663.1 hypothetical protein [Euryarchaeota archaeon]MAU74178.1 hypothetical protein [Euryarchaeota archaeon]MAU75172.1 hypothetical protein [Euryarchaeota archaeon]